METRLLRSIPNFSPQLRGWNTDLALPFDFVESLPSSFTRDPGKRYFSAKSDTTILGIEVRCVGKFWIHFKDEGSSEFQKHFFQTCSGLSDHPINQALVQLSADILDREKSRATSLDLNGLKATFRSIRDTMSLSNDDEQRPLSPLQVQALNYICRCVELQGHIVFRSGATFSASDGDRTVNLGRVLPEPLAAYPSLQVLLDKGKLVDFREDELWEGTVSPPYNIIERMSALAELRKKGLTQEAVVRLDRYVEALSTCL